MTTRHRHRASERPRKLAALGLVVAALGCRGDHVADWVSSQSAALVVTATAKLVPGARDTTANLAYGIGLAADGDVVAIAQTPPLGSTAGARVFVLERSGSRWNALDMLPPDGPAPNGTDFGIGIDIDADTIAVGAQKGTGTEPVSGVVHIYVRSGSDWVLEQSVTGSDTVQGDRFGQRVVLSGDRLVVGAPTKELDTFAEGAAYVFSRTNGAWSQDAKLIASDPHANGLFGTGIDLMGDTLIVGAPGASLATEPGGAGAAYVFELGPSGWEQTQRLSMQQPSFAAHFGASLAVDGEWLAVAAPEHGSPTTPIGVVSMFQRVAGQWEPAQTIASPETDAYEFGADLKFGSSRLVISSPKLAAGNPPPPGRALVYELESGTWELTNQVEGDEGQHFLGRSLALTGDLVWLSTRDLPVRAWELTATGSRDVASFEPHVPGDSPDGRFGEAVSADVERLLVGAPTEEQSTGAVYTFPRQGSRWHEPQTLRMDFSFAPGPGDEFGASVAVHGTTALIGTPGRSDDDGAVFVFRWDGDTWVMDELLQSFGVSGGRSGASVSIDDGVGLVGIPEAPDGGRVYAIIGPNNSKIHVTPPNGQPGDRIGVAVANDGNELAIGAPGDDDGGQDVGAIYAMDLVTPPFGWEVIDKLVPPASPPEGFGTSLAIDAATLVAGAPGANADAGKVYVYRRIAGAWGLETEIAATDLVAGDRFGHAVAVVAGTVAIAAPGQQPPAVYLYRRESGAWQQVGKRTYQGSATGSQFASAVSFRDGALVVGAPADDGVRPGAGAAYLFDLQLVDEPLGAGCSADSECESGHCVDGVCCNSACLGGAASDCAACSISEGAVTDGTCTSFPACEPDASVPTPDAAVDPPDASTDPPDASTDPPDASVGVNDPDAGGPADASAAATPDSPGGGCSVGAGTDVGLAAVWFALMMFARRQRRSDPSKNRRV